MKHPNKHAYLIIAHSDPYLLERLILLLDDKRNDIYIHVDIKSNLDTSFLKQLTTKSNITIVKKIDVCWGHISLIEVELLLYRLASTQEHYSYYHLLSGSDLPLKSQNEIHSFFEQYAGKEFIGFSDTTLDKNKIEKIHLYPKRMRFKSTEYTNRIRRKCRNIFIQLQTYVGYNRMKGSNIQFTFGSEWTSITHELVLELLQHEQYFKKLYKYACCSDEIYKQTYVYNSKFRSNVFNEVNELQSCQRYMDWKRGTPYTFREEDFEEIINSNLLFARKFESSVDKNIIDKIVKYITLQ